MSFPCWLVLRASIVYVIRRLVGLPVKNVTRLTSLFSKFILPFPSFPLRKRATRFVGVSKVYRIPPSGKISNDKRPEVVNI